MSVHRLINLAAVIVLLPGVLPSSLRAADHPDLETWLNADLLPYLENRMARHPRLKGEPFKIVAITDGEIVADMDGLTAYIQQRMMDKLQSVTGAHLIQPLPVKPWPEVGSLDDVDCHLNNAIHTEVTIETTTSAITQHTRVAVQALDLVQHEWVQGFKNVWTGKLNPLEQQRLAQRYTDRSLQGSRELPFDDTQSDLLASDLAHGISCALQGRSKTDVALFTVSQPAKTPVFFKNIAGMLNRYLGRFPEVQAGVVRDAADAVLRLNVQQIDGHLYQVWVDDIRDDRQRIRLTGLEVPVYVQLENSDMQPTLSIQTREAGKETSSPESARPLTAIIQFIVPADQRLCQMADVWAAGMHVSGRGTHLPSGGCFALRYQSNRPATLYLFSRSPAGRLVQLLPNPCNALGLGANGAHVKAGQLLHIPRLSNHRPGYFRLDNHAGVERIYVVAVADPVAESRLRLAAQALQPASPCRLEGRSHPNGNLEAMLKGLSLDARGSLVWQEHDFIHDPP